MSIQHTLIGAVLTLATATAPSACQVEPSAAPASQVSGPVPAYDRDKFGGWADFDGDGCTTREEVLARDSGAGNCPPKTDRQVTITDPYTGDRVTGRSEIDIDHVVSLRDAWHSGAHAWTQAQRAAFANDTSSHVAGCPHCSELVAASDDVNRAKSDEGPDEWRPSTEPGACFYAVTYRAVKDHYELVITPEQDAALADMCGGAP